MRALVLGGSTFIGFRLVRHLAARGHEVAMLNRGVTPVEPPAGVERLVADRTDTAAMQRALQGRQWDAVFDISGFVMAAGGSDVDALVDLFDGRVGRYVYCSSIMAYRPSGRLPWTEDFELTDDPPATYGGFKAHVEQALFNRHRLTGFPVTTVRPAAVYGPNNNIYDMEAAMFLRLERGLPVLVPHQGLVVCSYGHVDDLVRFLMDAADAPAAVGEAFNLTGEAVTVNHYVHTLAAIAGRDPGIVYLPDSALRSLPGQVCSHLFNEVHHSMLSIEKARQLLGFEPEFDFRSGHHDTYEWFMASGLAAVEDALRDPLWRASYDFALEAEVAAAYKAGVA